MPQTIGQNTLQTAGATATPGAAAAICTLASVPPGVYRYDVTTYSTTTDTAKLADIVLAVGGTATTSKFGSGAQPVRVTGVVSIPAKFEDQAYTPVSVVLQSSAGSGTATYVASIALEQLA